MDIPYKVYVNGIYFDYLADAGHWGDRPEFYRQHEKCLWTLYQIMKAGYNTIVITNEGKQLMAYINTLAELTEWIAKVYPGFTKQLTELVYTKYPHPADGLKLDQI